ncbi:hypothetical protein SAMN05444397_10758 [Flavobacterium aquidurense]|uniref:Lipoprotein n=1 Tax=Flavobacterium frigidimaris TaxID=262320 RepID=A0ABX4BTV2_FLAFR|nr:hypothetical protein [Flavobacterium frigidimaris]OXA81197.1 hypothetical protein B0A65_04630 [Flavobacterium frigidimaris]SDZ45805.1 hypothetical protein SAMN05444397_10758 [Flavobacterium aquidurense]
MKRTLLLLSSILTIGCSNQHAFVLNDSDTNKYFVLESINHAIERDQIGKSPFIVIDGNPFNYNKKQDTILLPLKKSDILRLDFLNKNSSRIIYNDKENDGAIIITTKIQKR